MLLRNFLILVNLIIYFLWLKYLRNSNNLKKKKELKEVKPFDYSKAESGETAGVATCVRLAYPDGSKRTLSILGLWDFDKALGIVSCQAPIALRVAGARAGDVISLPDPDFDDETLDVLVESVGPLPPEVLEWAK